MRKCDFNKITVQLFFSYKTTTFLRQMFCKTFSTQNFFMSLFSLYMFIKPKKYIKGALSGLTQFLTTETL